MDPDQSVSGLSSASTPMRSSMSMVLRQIRPNPPQRGVSHEIAESDEEGGLDKESNNIQEVDENGSDADGSGAELEPPHRRLSVSSNSLYIPSDEDPPVSVKAEPGTHPFSMASITHQRSKSSSFSPYRVIPPTPTHFRHHSYTSPRKRSRSSSPSALTDLPTRPAKYPRTKPFNHGYLALLNEDILSAADHFTPADRDPSTGELPPEHNLQPSLLGLTFWSETEKALFFEALSRLGPAADPAAIASRIRTKSPVEVADYLSLLRESVKKVSEAGRGGGDSIQSVTTAEIPAAVELSQACCAALEEAADVVAARQESYEEGVERKKWGDEAWLIRRENWRELEREMVTRMGVGEASDPTGGGGGGGSMDIDGQPNRFSDTPDMKSLTFFRVGAWLRLSERIFMNSAVDDYNWARLPTSITTSQNTNTKPRPSIRATALEDFYALTVEVTRRLVAATIWVSESRIRARRMLYPDARWRVWKQDAEAAALSLGLKTNTREFWAKCARRLRLGVYDSEDEGEGDGEEGWERQERDPLSYDDVERALGLEVEEREKEEDEMDELNYDSDSTEGKKDLDLDHSEEDESDAGSIELGGMTDLGEEGDDYPDSEAEDPVEKAAVYGEANELLAHSAFEIPKTRYVKAAVRKTIRAERAQEAYADMVDARASYAEEKRLWTMLGKAPPHELEKPVVPESAPKLKTMRKVEDFVRMFMRTPEDGKGMAEAVPSRWEMEYKLVEEERKEVKEEAKEEQAVEKGTE
ncbi:hypothetical protein VTJ04DRAFT_4486 [Mycothermus thermophilus]|uniref:uncharacterized protein n=1 Tax=Humicola insolens TaxID=85995 RepID=UPI0037443281